MKNSSYVIHSLVALLRPVRSWIPDYSLTIATGLLLGAIFIFPGLRIFVFLPPFLFLFFLKRIAKMSRVAAFGTWLGIFIFALVVFWNLGLNQEARAYVTSGLPQPAVLVASFVYVSFWILVSAWVALPYGLFGYLFWKWKRDTFSDTFLASSLWVLAEFLRVKLFFGINYVNVGYWLFGVFPPSGILGRFSGVWGLSFLTVFIAAFFFFLIFDARKSWASIFPCLLVIAALVAIGAWITKEYRSEPQQWDGKVETVVAIQGYIPWGNTVKRYEIAPGVKLPRNYIALLARVNRDKKTIMLLPEEVLSPLDLTSHSRQWTGEIKGLKKLREEMGTNIFIVGQGIRLNHELFNSFVALDNSGNPKLYFKKGLLPFAEYFPLGHFFIPQDLYEENFFSNSRSSTTLNTTEGALGMFSCVELLMPQLVRREINDQAQILLSGGSEIAWERRIWEQDLLEARFEAVTRKRFVVRALKRGYSAIINPLGDVLVKSNGRDDTVIQAKIALIDEKTLYTKIGDEGVLIGVMFLSFMPWSKFFFWIEKRSKA